MKTQNILKTLPIVWQRLVSAGQTCGRCGATHQAVRRSVNKLKKTLRPLGIEPTLETKEIDSRTFKARPSESNRIWIADKPLEEWIGAKVGRSRCDSVCGESKCRTVEGHEAVPEKLLLKAALIAASEMIRFSKIGWIAFFQKASPNTIPLTYYACRPQYEWLSRVQHDISAIG